MKITVLNGSPKGRYSITMKSINYLELKYPDIEFAELNLLPLVNKGDAAIVEAVESIAGSDGVIWAFPLYHLLTPGHMKAFIEKIFELDLGHVFKGMYATAFTTSINYFDSTAHEYMEGICNDLGSVFVPGLSHHMRDLMNEDKQEELCYFLEDFLTAINERQVFPVRYKKIGSTDYIYTYGVSSDQVTTDKKTIILTDAAPNSNVETMVSKYKSSYDGPLEVFNLNDIGQINYCIGCCTCGSENKCRFDHKDKYRQTLEHIRDNADILIYAFELKDRYFSAKVKTYFDRTFCYTHMPVFVGKQIGYLISGPLSQMPHMYEIINHYSTGEVNQVAVVTDESQDDDAMDRQIESMAKKSVRDCERHYIKSPTFKNVGAKWIFADEIKNNLFIFVQDYKYFSRHGYFKKYPITHKMRQFIFRQLFSFKPFINYVKNDMYHYMSVDHTKVIDGLTK